MEIKAVQSFNLDSLSPQYSSNIPVWILDFQNANKLLRYMVSWKKYIQSLLQTNNIKSDKIYIGGNLMEDRKLYHEQLLINSLITYTLK